MKTKSLATMILTGVCCLSLACSDSDAGGTDAASQSHSQGHSHGPGDEHDHAHDHAHGAPTPAEVVAATPSSLEFLRLAEGVTILDDIDAAAGSESSTFTHEGHFSPLLFAEDMRAFSIQLEAGMFLAEHPHATESLVFTVSGRWVLCSGGNRHVMGAGSLFHFASDAPTGWEAPFEGGAQLLIVKQRKPDETYATFTDGMRRMAERLDEELKEGRVFYFHQLEPDHPAIAFAKEHNPSMGALLEQWAETAKTDSAKPSAAGSGK